MADVPTDLLVELAVSDGAAECIVLDEYSWKPIVALRGSPKASVEAGGKVVICAAGTVIFESVMPVLVHIHRHFGVSVGMNCPWYSCQR